MGEIVNKRKMAAIIGWSERHLTERQKEGIPYTKAEKRGQENLYDTEAVIEWVIKTEIEKQVGDIKKSQARIAKLQADKLQIEVDLLEGGIIEVDEVRNSWLTLCHNFRARCLAIPYVIATQGVGLKNTADLEALATQKIKEVLSELADNEEASFTLKKDHRRGKGKPKASTRLKNK